MARISTYGFRLGALSLGILASACGSSSGTSSCSVTSVGINGPSGAITVGTPYGLTATVQSTGQCKNTVSWSVSPSGGATASATGSLSANLVASTKGSYTVVATSQDDSSKKASLDVTATDAIAGGTWDVALWDAASTTWQ
jgi:hypothetical protein